MSQDFHYRDSHKNTLAVTKFLWVVKDFRGGQNFFGVKLITMSENVEILIEFSCILTKNLIFFMHFYNFPFSQFLTTAFPILVSVRCKW